MKVWGLILRAAFWLVGAALLAVTRLVPALQHALLVLSSGLTADALRADVVRWGPWAPAASVLLMMLMTFLPFPADALILANGAAFGVWKGLLVSLAGGLLSGCVAFGLGRILGRRTVLRILPRPTVEWIDRAAHQGAWPALLALQFVPAVPYSILNFALGTTDVSWTTFLWTLLASIVPSDVALTAAGRGIAEGGSAAYWVLAALLLAGLTAWAVRRWGASAVKAR